MKQTIRYLTESNRKDGMPNDSVARFHIGNGASLERINLKAVQKSRANSGRRKKI